MFRLRPYCNFLGSALFLLIVGGLLSAYFFAEDSRGTTNHRWMLALAVTLCLSLSLVIVAFSRHSFQHLRHQRPKC